MPLHIESSLEAAALISHTSEDMQQVDEPPETRSVATRPAIFQRSSVKTTVDQHPSLLTKAIMGEAAESRRSSLAHRERRPSLSTASVASTADLMSDNGMTSPSRTNSPSPPIPNMGLLQISSQSPDNSAQGSLFADAVGAVGRVKGMDTDQTPVPALNKKRCIQFACAAKPLIIDEGLARPATIAKAPSAEDTPRRPSLKFLCPWRATSAQAPSTATKATSIKSSSPSTQRKLLASNMAGSTSPGMGRKSPGRAATVRPKFLRANSSDLVSDGSQFHEFASERLREEDWIRQEAGNKHRKLTINDTLTKENVIRKLAKEAEEEAEIEEEEDEAELDGENVQDLEDDDDQGDEYEDGEEEEDDEDEEEEEEDDDDDDDDDVSVDEARFDGYSTDEETGFAESDDSGDENDDMDLWTLGHGKSSEPGGMTPIPRRPTLQKQHSDASTTASDGSRRRSTAQRVKPIDCVSDLPDSTDFVCGTLDEDRPVEQAYLQHLAARRLDKLRLIPQDIDPSFPTSDPEDKDEEERYNPVHHDSDDEDGWVAGEMDDLHHGQERAYHRRKSEHASPRRYRSPPPPQKRRHSPPPPKQRARSPKLLFERQSPRRYRSPAPRKAMTTPLGSPRHGAHAQFNLAGRPGLVLTKSLPRPGALFTNMRHGRPCKNPKSDDIHIRGAIDIVKGLERKRQRRREKFFHKYCNRARRGQLPERRAQPGQGVERMKELGLMMAGKKDQCNYVLSV